MLIIFWGNSPFVACSWCLVSIQIFFTYSYDVNYIWYKLYHFQPLYQVHRFLVSKESVVLCWWESETWKFCFIKQVDKGRISTLKDLESWHLSEWRLLLPRALHSHWKHQLPRSFLVVIRLLWTCYSKWNKIFVVPCAFNNWWILEIIVCVFRFLTGFWLSK